MLASSLRNVAPKWAGRLVPQELKDRMFGAAIDYESLPSFNRLKSLMGCYQVKDLVNVDPESFKRRIDEFLELRDYKSEGYQDPTKQRDLSIRFHWGHNHDFGDFLLKGRLGDRHIALLASLVDWFKVLPLSLQGLTVLDIGCWSGGTSLLLVAMGAHVVAIEEVKKYIDCLQYLKHAFNLVRLEPVNLSLYECTAPELQDRFDIVLFAGVLYHLSDPVLGLRITYNCLKDGGQCMVETAVTPSKKKLCAYEGPGVIHGGGSQKDLIEVDGIISFLLPRPFLR